MGSAGATEVSPWVGRGSGAAAAAAGGAGPKRGFSGGNGMETDAAETAARAWFGAGAEADKGADQLPTSGRDVICGGAWPGTSKPHSHLQSSSRQLSYLDVEMERHGDEKEARRTSAVASEAQATQGTRKSCPAELCTRRWTGVEVSGAEGSSWTREPHRSSDTFARSLADRTCVAPRASWPGPGSAATPDCHVLDPETSATACFAQAVRRNLR